MKNKKVRNNLIITVSVLMLIPLTEFLVSILHYPLYSDLYSLIGVEKEEIAEIRIYTMGEAYPITDPETVQELTAEFDCGLRRKESTFMKTYSPDWFIVFVTKDGTKNEGFYVFPSDKGDSDQSMIQKGRYIYQCDEDISYKLLKKKTYRMKEDS